MKKSGLADSPFFAASRQKEPAPPPSGEDVPRKPKRQSHNKKNKQQLITHQSIDRSTKQLTGRPIDPPTTRPIDQSTDQQTDVDALGPVVERPRAFYITQKVDRWLNEAVRYLQDKGMHKADRSVLVNALLHDPKLFLPSSLDEMRARLLAHLTNKSLKRTESTDQSTSRLIDPPTDRQTN